MLFADEAYPSCFQVSAGATLNSYQGPLELNLIVSCRVCWLEPGIVCGLHSDTHILNATSSAGVKFSGLGKFVAFNLQCFVINYFFCRILRSIFG